MTGNKSWFKNRSSWEKFLPECTGQVSFGCQFLHAISSTWQTAECISLAHVVIRAGIMPSSTCWESLLPLPSRAVLPLWWTLMNASPQQCLHGNGKTQGNVTAECFGSVQWQKQNAPWSEVPKSSFENAGTKQPFQRGFERSFQSLKIVKKRLWLSTKLQDEA